MEQTRCLTCAISQSSTPTMLLECPESSFTETASASEYIESKMTRSAARKNPTKSRVSGAVLELVLRSVV